MNKLHAIQMLRAIACALVIVSHTIGRGIRSESIDVPEIILANSKFIIIGHLGVDLFFVISGFILYLIHSKDFGSYTAMPKFFLQRLIRVVPIYWILTTVALILLLYRPDLFSYRGNIEIPWVLGSYLFVPIPTTYGLESPVLGVGWTLNYEMFFYVVFGLLIAFQRKFSLPLLLMLFLLLVLLGDRWDENKTNNYVSLITSPLIIEFLFGVVVAWLYINFYGLIKRYKKYLLVISILIFIYSVFNLPDSYGDRLIFWGFPSALIVLYASLLKIERRKSFLLNCISKFGDASYSAYLIQVFSIPLFSLIYSKLEFQIYLGFIGYVFFIFSFTVILSLYFWRYIETPLTGLLKSKFLVVAKLNK